MRMLHAAALDSPSPKGLAGAAQDPAELGLASPGLRAWQEEDSAPAVPVPRWHSRFHAPLPFEQI